MQFNLSKILSFILTLVSLQIGFSQSPTAYFDDNAPNLKYLEHLIKVGVDEVRKDLGINPLVNDSILYLAAADHAQFLLDFKRLTHYQSKNPSKRTPQSRVEFYGAKNYNVGENIASLTYRATSETYGEIAESFVSNWVNSPGHYQNIITPKYEVTGVNVSMDKETRILYACQKFAHVELRFVFAENRDLFPYSDYTPPPQVTSFDEVANQLIPKYKYPYKLRHDKLEKCDRFPNQFDESPNMSLKYDKARGYTLRIENSDYVQQLIRHKNDGFAIEIVDYEDFACGSPFYYEKPSRRNGQLRLSGKTLEPLYRKALFKGYKRRKKEEEIKFFPYIFRKDSVSFFRRFGQFKTDRYSSEYFEIRLGKLPRNSPRLHNANLIVIKDKQICDVIYFRPYCGDVYEEYLETDFIPYQYDDFQYEFNITPDEISFSIPFEQGQVDFEKETILNNIGSLSEYDFFIDSVKIHAYSSIEGDSVVNARLQINRAENIAGIFQGIQEQEIDKSITTSLNWKDFRKEIARSRETNNLRRLNNKDLLEVVNRHQSNFEPQLAPTRRGDIKVFFHVLPNKKSLDYYIQKEWSKINLDIKTKRNKREDYENELNLLADLYKYTYAMVKKDYLAPSFFLALHLPREKDENLRLIQYHILFGFEYPTVFSNFREWKKDSSTYINKYKYEIDEKIEFIPEFNYLLLKLISDDLIRSKNLIYKEYKTIKSKSIRSEDYYLSTQKAKVNIDKINFNLNMLTLNHYYESKPKEHQENAIMALSQVYEYYDKNELMYDTLAVNLAYMAVFYEAAHLAVNFITPCGAKDQKIKALIHELAYIHPSKSNSAFYYSKLIIDSHILPPSIWCNMFINPCGIPFQAFDDENLRKRYCELCEGENVYLNEILFEKK